jgi:hypothetical protein
MLRGMRTCLVCGLAAAPFAGGGETRLEVTVLTYNYAGLPAEDLSQAEREAARIFERAGIETAWLDCPLAPSDAERYPACQVPITPTTLVVRILSRAMAGRLTLEPSTLGSALFPEDGSFAMVAMLCGDRAAELAHRAGSPAAGALLGDLIAHELGHLLLGPGNHSRVGIMHTPWNITELGPSMQFTSAQAAQLRRSVADRLRDPQAPASRTLLAHQAAGVRPLH